MRHLTLTLTDEETGAQISRRLLNCTNDPDCVPLTGMLEDLHHGLDVLEAKGPWKKAPKPKGK